MAALFAWHPVHVESVAWVSERKDVLSTFFGLFALLAYVRYTEESEAQNPSAFAKVAADDKAKVWWRWALAFFALGLMAKPMLVTLPFVMLLLDVWPLGRLGSPSVSATLRRDKQSTGWYLILEKIPFFVLTVASCVVTYLAQREEAVMSFERRPPGLRLANAAVAYVEYLAKTVCPIRLAVFYPLPGHVPAWQVAVAVAILAALTVLACVLWRRAPYVLVGWLWFLGMLVPVIGIIQVGGQALADRYAYIPLVGVFIAVAYGAADLKVRFRVKTPQVSTAAGVVLACCLIGYSSINSDFGRTARCFFNTPLR